MATFPVTGTGLTEAVYNHITLPARLPGHQDHRPDKVERALVERLYNAAAKLEHSPEVVHTSVWASIRRSLDTCKTCNAGSRLSKLSLVSAFRELQGQDVIILHVVEQNAALLIKRQPDAEGERVCFEAFEASPLSEDVLAAKKALQWDFPGSAVSIPLSRFNDPNFQEELATFLEKASTESIKRFAARTSKAGSFAYESRDTADPALITQMFMALLEVIGRRENPTLLRKRVRDDVCWSKGGGDNPWRRCPLWLVLRVALQRQLCAMIGGELGRIQYKHLMCLVLSHFLKECVLQLSIELSAFLKTKLCRRLVKLEVEKERASPSVKAVFTTMLEALGPDLRRTIIFSTKQIERSWESWKQTRKRPVFSLPRSADERHLYLTLPNSGHYLWKVRQPMPQQLPTSKPGTLEHLPQEYHLSSSASKPGIVFARRYFRLTETEAEIESKNIRPVPSTSEACKNRCRDLAGTIVAYLGLFSDVYSETHEQNSLMILTVMETWMAMDMSAVEAFPLLKNYGSGIPSDILDVLQLARAKDVHRLHKIRTYLQEKVQSCNNSHATIFDDPDEDCFAVRYYNLMPEGLLLQRVHRQIVDAADEQRAAKEQEMKSLTAEYERLVRDESAASCVFNIDDQTNIRIHNDKQCTKCFLGRKIYRFRMRAHEYPLPSNIVQTKAVVFEMMCPEAYTAYRDATWRILSTLALPIAPQGFTPCVLLKEYTELKRYTNSMTSTFSLASTTKSFLDTHYASPRFPVSIADVCLANGLKFSYYDTHSDTWPSLLKQKPTLAHHFSLTMPSNSPYFRLDFASQTSMAQPELSSYEIVSSQTRCPAGLNVLEFLAFQSLCSGKSRRWLQILLELGSSTINFSTEATANLVQMLALQVGPTSGESYLGAIHSIFLEESFCRRLLEQLDQRLNGISSNWRETHCMETLITLGLRLFELGPTMLKEASAFLEKARTITSNWISALRHEVQTLTDSDASQRCSQYTLWAALLCRRTFAMYQGTILNRAALHRYIDCSIALQDNMISDPARLPKILRDALIRDLKAIYHLAESLRSSLDANRDSLISSITSIWPDAEGSMERISSVEFLPNDNKWWVQIIVQGTSDINQQTIHFHILEGHLLVMGKAVGKLPPKWRTAGLLQELFGDQNLLAYPSSLPGMMYMLKIEMNHYSIHLGFRNDEMIIRARVRDTVLELIPRHVFGSSLNFDLPAPLTNECFHWMDLKTGIIEVRPKEAPWRSKLSNWLIDTNHRRAICRKSSLLDPHSRLFKRIDRIFEHFEDRHHLTVYQPAKGRLTVALKRLELSFFVNKRGQLECPELGAEIDTDQDAGTWYGLDSQVVLRQVASVQDPVTGYRASVPQSQRSILVPMGTMTYRRHGPHIQVKAANSGAYGSFAINEILGRLDCAAEPRLLYLKAQYHAYTSFFVPDPLTGRTGTEESLHCLKSGYCQPWQPVASSSMFSLGSIARLTPQRQYYPKDRRVMQTVNWDPNLPVIVQHDGYRDIIEDIREKSNELSMFSQDPLSNTLTPLEPPMENHLTARSLQRRESYQRPNASSASESAQDVLYTPRDRTKSTPGRSNVMECAQLISIWPSSFATTRDLGGMMRTWPNIGGYNGCFRKGLLSDLLDPAFNCATHWGSMVNLCLSSRVTDSYSLMFLFACLSFRHDADMTTLRVLMGFAVWEQLQSLAPPKWDVYTQFRHKDEFRIGYLLQLIKPYLTPYVGEEAGFGDLTLGHRSRKKIEKALLSHEHQQEQDSWELANFLLKQWPCAEPTIKGFNTSTLIDIRQALQAIRPEWLRLFQNFEHSNYISQVQKVLDSHHSEPLQVETDVLELGEQEIFASRVRGGELPALSDLLLKAGPASALRCAHTISPIAPAFFSQTSQPSLRPIDQNVTRGQGQKDKSFKAPQRAVKHKELIAPEIKQLQAIIADGAKSGSSVERQYVADLGQSLDALKLLYKATIHQQSQQPRSAATISKDIVQARSHLQDQMKGLRQAFEKGDSAIFLKNHGGLSPCMSPVAVLETLRSGAQNSRFGEGMKSGIIDYALAVTYLQRLSRMEAAIQKHDMQRLIEEQGNFGHVNWNVEQHADWLLLEIDANFLIRPGQIDVAMATIAPASGANSVLQMNMGAGKTSCIMPMAAAALANGKNLLRLVVPKSLLLQTAQLLHGRLGGLLGRELRHVPFSRKTPTNKATIQTFYKIHRAIQKSSGAMVALPEHILSFKLSGLQRLSDGRIPEANTMLNIQGYLEDHARDVLDECDNILATKVQLIYPSGSQKSLDGHPHRWEVAQVLLHLVDGHLYNLQKLFPQSIEVVRRGQGAFPVAFFLRHDVEDALISRLVEDIYRGRTSIFPPETMNSDRAAIKTFISEPKVTPDVAELIRKMFPNKPASRQILYLLRGLLVHRILLSCIKKRWNVQYGLHPMRDPIAVPYHAKGTPSDQAEWGHPDVTILLTCLAFYYDGLSIDHLRQTLEHCLKSDDPSQTYDSFCNASTLPDSLKDWNAINVDDEPQLKEVWPHFRYNVAAIDYFLNNFVFPQNAKQFQVKLQASGWDLPLFSTNLPSTSLDAKLKHSHALTTGFSGTNDWKRMLPMTVHQHDLFGLAHTNAEVLTYLLQPRNSKYILAAQNGKHISEYELLRKIHNEKIRVLIDAGAQILELDNLSLVKAWLEIDHEAPAAIYIDRTNRPSVYYRGGHQTPLLASPYAEDSGECLVYLDEAHTRGTDLKMPIRSCGALTLGLGQTKDHTVQAAMRLRQLGTSQSIVFFAPSEVHQSILDLRKKRARDQVTSLDVIYWLVKQTCEGIEQLQPLYYAQGTDFCRRAQAALDYSGHVQNSTDRDAYLTKLLQVEQQTLEQFYGPHEKLKSSVSTETFHPKLRQLMKELGLKRKGYQDSGNAVHASALQEVEQEREVAYEVETVREVQKPVHHQPLKFPGLHRDLISFAKHGRLAADSAGYEAAFSAIGRLTIGRKHKVGSNATSGKLYASTEFSRTVRVPTGRVYDDFQRPVNWVLWSSTTEVAIIITSEEVELLIPLVRYAELPVSHILTYSAPVTRKMFHFNSLQYYAIPSLPPTWEAPIWLRIELGIYSGRLYFEHREYSDLLKYLGVKEERGKIEDDEEKDEGEEEEDIFGDEIESIFDDRPEAQRMEEKKPIFCRKPLTFLQEWLAIKRKGQDFAQTPMGFITQGKPLAESHPFFLQHNTDPAGASISMRKIGVNGDEDDDDEGDGAFGDAHVYDDVGNEVDQFDDRELDLDEDSKSSVTSDEDSTE